MNAEAARPGLVALGDSITNGEGDSMLGVPPRSWADWLARSLGLPVLNLAENGATVPSVRASQLPRVDSAFAVGAIYAGVNDVRSPAFSLDDYASGLDELFAGVAAHTGRLVTCTIPLDLGRPRAGAKVADANAVIHATAARYGAAVADLDGLRGPTMMLPDAVHPTAAGQLEIADRAARALALAPPPSTHAPVDRSTRSLVRFAVLRHGPAQARDWARRSVEAIDRWSDR